MNNTDLKKHLENLHQELKTVEVVDEDSQRLLEEIQDDVQLLLSQKGDEPSQHHKPVKERLAESARHFDASHPTLAAAIRAVVNTLKT